MPIGQLTAAEVAALKRALEFGYKSGNNSPELDLVIGKLNSTIGAVDGGGSIQTDRLPLAFAGPGQFQLAATHQPKAILGVYFKDLTAPDYPNTAPDLIVVEPADYADAVLHATPDIIVSYDTNGNILLSDGGSSLLVNGHNYEMVVKYLY
jgi:hypothetical protein